MAELLTRWADIAAINQAGAVLGWDQETTMPPKGQTSRGRTLAVLAGLAHDKLTDPALADLVAAAGAEAEHGSIHAAHVREAERAVVRATAVPGSLARAKAEATSTSLVSWQAARAADDFSLFAPDLARVVALTFEEADAYVDAGIAVTRYDAMLDEFEPGTTELQLVPLLGALREELAPLVQTAADRASAIDESPCIGHFAGDGQEAFGRMVARKMGYDFDAGRLDESAHPFTTSFGPNDVRITWRWQTNDFRPGLFGVMHEAGHALYEQGLPAAWDGTPIGGAVSLGVHESQSRLWENQVGRSRAFWEWALPQFIEHFPDAAGTTVDQLFPALHTVTPSLVRVEADEATYNLHVVARFEIERALFAGEVEVADLPERWAATYEELLGVRPPSAADGVLQDIHWSMGAFGYFPTYTLGNLLSAQLFEAAGRALGSIDDLLRAGEFDQLLGWLRTNVHAEASRWSASELIERATGAPLSSEPFLRHLRTNVAEVYG